MDAAAKQQVVEKYVEAFAQGSLDLIREIFDENAVVEDPVGTEPYVGIDAITGFYSTGFEMGAKLSLTGATRSAGQAVAFPFIVDAGGMKIEVIDVFEFNEAGKVVSMRAYWGAENAS